MKLQQLYFNNDEKNKKTQFSFETQNKTTEQSFYIVPTNVYPPIPRNMELYIFLLDNRKFVQKVDMIFDPYYLRPSNNITFMTYFNPVRNTVPLYFYNNGLSSIYFSFKEETNMKPHPASPIFVMVENYNKWNCENGIMVPDKKGSEYNDIFSECFAKNNRLVYNGDIERDQKDTSVTILVVIIIILIIGNLILLN
jgi:hypothetical protein